MKYIVAALLLASSSAFAMNPYVEAAVGLEESRGDGLAGRTNVGKVAVGASDVVAKGVFVEIEHVERLDVNGGDMTGVFVGYRYSFK